MFSLRFVLFCFFWFPFCFHFVFHLFFVSLVFIIFTFEFFVCSLVFYFIFLSFLSASLFLFVWFCFYHLSWVWFVCFHPSYFVCCFTAVYFCFCYFSWVLFVSCFLFFFFFSLFFLWLCHVIFRLLVPQPEVRPGPPGWERWVQDAGSPENSQAQEILIGMHSPWDIQDTKTWLLPTACRIQGWTPHAKQPARQEHNPTHQQIGCLKLY